jgi:hypothetical protein
MTELESDFGKEVKQGAVVMAKTTNGRIRF